MSIEMDDDRANNVMATGGILAVLHCSSVATLPETIMDDDGNATNQIRVHLHFMKSPYIITIERDPDGH